MPKSKFIRTQVEDLGKILEDPLRSWIKIILWNLDKILTKILNLGRVQKPGTYILKALQVAFQWQISQKEGILPSNNFSRRAIEHSNWKPYIRHLILPGSGIKQQSNNHWCVWTTEFTIYSLICYSVFLFTQDYDMNQIFGSQYISPYSILYTLKSPCFFMTWKMEMKRFKTNP